MLGLLMNRGAKSARVIRLKRVRETQLNQDFPRTDELRVIGNATFSPRFVRESCRATL